ncbi:DUF1236 domain-containing protein [Hyphomicrobium sp. NDB2Meth4]|uniref:DUF1236 domain-containing protein n=1 Tax=Hyphomicrobium sp. NDB2Meth4 TaxID=1892846 RepID=UPI0009318E0F|nr:DUF1236 domain-containing protein [Hyphomicrobium sp. NDB2Meth4]
MRTIASLLAVLLLGTASMAIAQDGPKARGNDAGGPGGGPAAERGGGPDMNVERGAKGDGGGAGRAMERSNEQSADSPRQRERSQAKSDEPSEKRTSKHEGRNADKERSVSKTDKARPSDDNGDKSKSQEKAAAADKAEGKEDRQNAKTEDSAAGSKQSEAKGQDSADERAESKASGDRPAKRINLTEAKRDGLRSAFSKEKNLKPRAHVDVNISVGRRLPRDWHYRPVPIAVIEIVPEYRDYVFVYADDEYVICDPETYEVVAVVPAGGARYANNRSGGSDRCSARLSLSRDEREMILDEVRMNDEVDVRDLKVGWSVPSNVELKRFSDEVTVHSDELSACRYFVARDQLAIVDPVEEKVILVIDKG